MNSVLSFLPTQTTALPPQKERTAFAKPLFSFLLVGLLSLMAIGSWGQTYTQITTLGELTNGSYLIVGDGTINDGAMLNTVDATPFINRTVITNPGSTITTGVTAANVFSITVSGGSITIYNASVGYVSWGRTGVTGNHATFFNGTVANTERWTPTVATGLWTLANVGTAARLLQWNNANPRFAAYTSAQVKLKLYKMDAAVEPDIDLGNANGTQVADADVVQGTNDHVLSTFQFYVSDADATLEEAYFITSGNYQSGDISSFKLWSSETNDIETATQIGSTFTSTSTGSGDLLEFTGMTHDLIDDVITYFWITGNVAGAATAGRTISVDEITAADFVFTDGEPTGTADEAGVQTIITNASPILNAGTLDAFGNVCINTTSSELSFTLTGSNLNGSDVSISGNAAYQFATSSGGSFSNPLTLTAYSGTSPSVIYVHFTPTAVTSYDGNITLSGGGDGDGATVAVAGSGITVASIDTQPSAQSVVVGNTANFTVAATGATSYQWQVNTGSGWNNVTTGSGETTNSYTTENTTLGMSGYLYRVQVINACGSVTSSEVALTVTTAAIYEKINSLVELTDGDYVIAYDSTFAMNNTYVSSTYLDRTAISPVSDQITNPPASIVWHIETNGSGRTIYNAESAKYVSFTGASNNVQIVDNVTTDNQRWAVTYPDDAFVFNNVAVTARMLKYNNGSPRFACYTTTQNDLTLYKLSVPLVPAPAVAVTQGASPIAHGAGSYPFGNQLVSTSSSAVTFTITNSGTADLDITDIALSGAGAGDFSVTQALASTVAASGTTTFTATFSPTTVGPKEATVTISSNAANYTFNLTGTGTYSTESNIIAVPAYTYTDNIDYTIYQSATISNTGSGAGGSIGVFQLTVQDGGGANDGDDESTILNELTIGYTGAANTIRAASLFLVNTQVAAGTVSANAISFSGLSIEALDNSSSSNYTLRVTYNTSVVDNQQLQFTVTSALAASTGSIFANVNAGGATSSVTGDRNRLEVTADRLRFTTQPTGQSVSVNLAPFVVAAVDVNNNVDLDASGSVDITTSGTGMTATNPYALSAGAVSIANIQFGSVQADITLTATTTGLANDNDDVSNAFSISDVTGGTYRTATSGTWPGGTATWERFTSGWGASSAPAASTTDLMIIRHAITTSGAFSASGGVGTKMEVASGGSFTDAHNSTFQAITVKSGGQFIAQNPAVDMLAGTGLLTVEPGGLLVINSATLNHGDGLFDGIEDFQPGSTVEVRQYDNDTSAGEDDLVESGRITPNSEGYYFGNLFINFTNNETKAFTLVGVTGNQKLCSNDLTVTNTSATQSVLLTNVNASVEIKGNLTVTQNRFGLGGLTASTPTHLIKGDIIVNGASAILDLNTSSSGSAAVIVNLEGNFSCVSGTVQSTDDGCKYVFVGTTAIQTISIAGTLSPRVDFEIASGAEVQLVNQHLNLANATNDFTVLTGGTLAFNYFNLTGAGGFTQQTGGILKITDANGVNAVGLGTGNIQTATRTYSQLGHFHYVGNVTPQGTGNAMTSGSTAKRIVINKDNNSDIVNLTQSTGTSNELVINRGVFVETAAANINGGGRLLMTDGTFRTSVLNVDLPQLTGHGSYALTGGTVELNGSGDQVLKGSPAGGYYNVAVTNSGNKTVTSGFVIANNLLITNGVMDFASYTVSGDAGITMTGGRLRMSRVSASLPELDGFATPYNLTGGTIELYGTSATQQHSLRTRYGSPSTPISYFNVDLNAVAANVQADSVGANVVASAGSFIVQGAFNVNSPACFRLSSAHTVTGSGSFNVLAGSTFKYGGTIDASGATGSVQTTTRNFSSLASYGFVGSITPQVAGTGLPASVVNLYMDKTDFNNQVQMNSDVIVTSTLQFYNGIANAGGNVVIIAEGGTVANAGSTTGWVNGGLRKHVAVSATNNLFEVGTNAYTPASIDYNNVTVAGDMTVRTIAGDHPELAVSNLNSNLSVNRIWNVANSGIVMDSYSPTFNFVNADKDAGLNTSILNVGLYNAIWSYPVIGARTANSTQALTVSDFGDFALAQNNTNPPVNDNPAANNPSLASVNYVYPNCNNIQGSTTGATVNPATGSRDVFYQFTSISNGVSVRVSSNEIDPVIYLLDASNNVLDTETLVAGTGAEVLNFGSLVPNQTYRIAVASASLVDGAFSLCLQQLRNPLCGTAAPYTLCTVFKSSVTGAQSTTFSFTQGMSTTSITSATPITLSNAALGLYYGETYATGLTANYTLQNGLGQNESIQVANPNACNITLEEHQAIEVKSNQRCENGAVLYRSSYLQAASVSGVLCGVTGYRVEFTPVSNCLGEDAQVLETFSKTITSPTASISLSYAFNQLAPLANYPHIGYWSVRWLPRFGSVEGEYGAAHVIGVNGTSITPSGMTTEDVAVANGLDNVNAIAANIYPNPNNGDMVNLNMTGITSNDVFVRIMDSMGRVVYTNRFSVDGSLNTIVTFSKPLAGGLYMVEFTAGDEVITQRMMVSK